MLSNEILNSIRKNYPKGTLIKLNIMDDPQAPPSGTFGVVTGVDDSGALMMKWETGSSLSLICNKNGKFIDSFEVVGK